MRLLPALLLAGAAAQAQVVRVDADEPRAYGYHVGDLVERRVVVHVPAGWTLDRGSIPQPGGRGRSIELRRVDHREQGESGGTRHELQLQYQVFLAPSVVRTLETASFRLRVQGPGRQEEARVEGWPVTVAPLVPVEVSPRRGLGEWQPDAPVPRVPTAPMEQRLVLWGALAALVALGLALAYAGPPWRAWRSQPFGRAWRSLRGLPAQPADADWLAACRTLHEALNATAGEVLFEGGVARFVAAKPGFQALHDDLVRFLRLSRAQFFGGAPRAADDAAWLRTLARRCRDAERGLAR